MSNVSESIMRGLHESLEDAQGKRILRSHAYVVAPAREYKADEIKEIRNGLGMSQVLFASFMSVSKKTVEAWESGRNRPDGPARRILSMVQKDPSLPEKYNIVAR
jgi:putative transcriptional regulator